MVLLYKKGYTIVAWYNCFFLLLARRSFIGFFYYFYNIKICENCMVTLKEYHPTTCVLVLVLCVIISNSIKHCMCILAGRFCTDYINIALERNEKTMRLCFFITCNIKGNKENNFDFLFNSPVSQYC